MSSAWSLFLSSAKKAKLTPVRFIGITKKGKDYFFEDRIAKLAEPEGGGEAIIV